MAEGLVSSDIPDYWSGGAIHAQVVVFNYTLPVRVGQDSFHAAKRSEHIQVFWWYHLVGLVWTAEFILAAQQMLVAGAVATWYFTR